MAFLVNRENLNAFFAAYWLKKNIFPILLREITEIIFKESEGGMGWGAGRRALPSQTPLSCLRNFTYAVMSYLLPNCMEIGLVF